LVERAVDHGVEASFVAGEVRRVGDAERHRHAGVGCASEERESLAK
jgi:hypothetical protein